MEQADCLDRVRLGRELDESEAPRVASLSIGRQVHLDDAARLGQKLRQGLCGGASVQIPHEDTG